MKINKKIGAIIILGFGITIAFVLGYYLSPGIELGAIFFLLIELIVTVIVVILFIVLTRFISIRITLIGTLVILLITEFYIFWPERAINYWAKYQINITPIEKEFIPSHDTLALDSLNILLTKHFYSSIQCYLKHSYDNVYYDTLTKKSYPVSDTILDYTVDHVITNNSKKIILYFITYREFNYVHTSDLRIKKMQFYDIGTAAISVQLDSNNSWEKYNIPENTGGNYYWRNNKIENSDTTVIRIRKQLLAYLMVDFHFGEDSFWNNVMIYKK